MRAEESMAVHVGVVCFCLSTLITNIYGNPVLNPSNIKVGDELKNGANPDDVKSVDAIDSDNLKPLENDPNKDHVLKFERLDKIRKNDELSLDKLKPVDHIDALKLEQDGHLNKEYHKELFLGDHEQFERDGDNADAKLMDIFNRVDFDHDGNLTESEMEGWIIEKMDEHFGEALQENEEIFKHLDPDGNGVVHWKEYYTHFLLAKGYDEEKAKKHVKDYDEIELDTDAKEELVRYKFRWTDADFDPADNELNKTEFLGFRHPEQSDKTISTMVFSIMNSMDTDENGKLSLTEFIALPPGEVEGDEEREMDNNWQQDRTSEFNVAIDKNKDGEVTPDELKAYLDPRNPMQALMEARNLITLMDTDGSKSLTKDEVLKHKDIFLSSKVADFAANVHDEF